ncbi:hypothetical protein KZ555_004108 [Escherichia coli]|nr:hypothetical protein [Escherichia coli]EFN4072970.1 hypothetical protein [Escherichia coli]EHK3056904.1 hypothetical protein [Escherichia coli]EHU9797124.1 hypothetical protein [Escherichia coli]EHU9798892.1 hypothetical protein [Escherichia coli]
MGNRTRNGKAWVAVTCCITSRKTSLYKNHSLRFDFTNESSAFDKNGNNKISIRNVKSTASLNFVTGRGGAQADISLYGLGIERLADISGKADGIVGEGQKLNVEVFADDSLVFSGTMLSSIANMNSAPESSLMITASSNVDLQNMAARPFTAQGTQSVEDVISSICASAGYEAVFNNVKGMTTSGSPHFEGSVFEQLYRVCSDYGLAMSATPPTKVEFWPSEKNRDDVIPFISREYGLVGYPVFSNGGLMFQTQYSSLLCIGRYVDIKTELPHASGRYKLTSVRHELSSWMPNGSWHSICIAARTAEQRAEAQQNNG